MVSGHSYLPCDRAFGNIEKQISHTDVIHCTQNYLNLIKAAKSPPFEVVPMERQEFYDIKALAKFVTKRQTQTSFSKACQLVVNSSYKEGYVIKTNYEFGDSDSNMRKCRLMKTNKRYSAKLFDLSTVPLVAKYPTERLLNPRKVKDLETLSQFLGPSSREWLLDLIHRQKVLETAGRSMHEEDDEEVGSDSENYLLDYDDPVRVLQI